MVLLQCAVACGMVLVLAGAAAAAAQPVPPVPVPPVQPVPPLNGFFNRAVGGVMIDGTGLLENASLDALGELKRQREALVRPAGRELARTTAMRKVSLRRLDAAIQKCLESGKPFPDEIRFLAGLQQIQHVFVYPEQRDIVLVGPGEGWKLDAKGHVVGATTGRPVLLLDDLLVALRSAGGALKQGGISCSIDPRPEGLQQLRAAVAKMHTIGKPEQTAATIERALGPQVITLAGVPADSHFGRVLVAADYRMKRIAMDFEPAPIEDLPSFMQMLDATGHGMSNMLPRWWLAPEYQAILRDSDGLAWELRGSSVKALTEDDMLTASGDRRHTGKPNPVAQRWADNMTRHYDRLALAEPIFGQLRNCADLAVVGSLIAKEDLLRKAGCDLPAMLGVQKLPLPSLPVPRLVDSKTSMLRKGDKWLISASGGVKFDLRAILEKAEITQKLIPVRNEAALGVHEDWWWN